MWQLDTGLYCTEKIIECPCVLFVNNTEQIKLNCRFEVIPQLHIVAYNIKKNPWAMSLLSTEIFQGRSLKKTYHIATYHIVQFQLLHLAQCEWSL